MEILILVIGALITIGATVIGVFFQERLTRARNEISSQLTYSETRRDRRYADVSAATGERHTAYILLAISDLYDSSASSPDQPSVPIRSLAGTRLAQAVLLIVGVTFGEEDPEQAMEYVAKEQLDPHIQAAQVGHMPSIIRLNQAYEKVFGSWVVAYNGLTTQNLDRSEALQVLDTKLMRVKYATATLQILGVFIALFRDIAI